MPSTHGHHRRSRCRGKACRRWSAQPLEMTISGLTMHLHEARAGGRGGGENRWGRGRSLAPPRLRRVGRGRAGEDGEGAGEKRAAQFAPLCFERPHGVSLHRAARGGPAAAPWLRSAAQAAPPRRRTVTARGLDSGPVAEAGGVTDSFSRRREALRRPVSGHCVPVRALTRPGAGALAAGPLGRLVPSLRTRISHSPCRPQKLPRRR